MHHRENCKLIKNKLNMKLEEENYKILITWDSIIIERYAGIVIEIYDFIKICYLTIDAALI